MTSEDREDANPPMRTKSITASNFKSLINFKLDLAKFTCLIGLNGAGKSTVLQFVDFLGQQARGDIQGWLKERQWVPKEIGSTLTTKKNIDFSLSVTAGPEDANFSWTGSFNTMKLHCTSEHIETPDVTVSVDGGQIRMHWKTATESAPPTIPNGPISFAYEGSILSQLRDELLPSSVVEFKRYIKGIKSLDLLSPQYLRQKTRDASGSMGLGGQRLSAFFHELGREGRVKVNDALRSIYKQLEAVNTKSLRSGWKQLEVVEEFDGKRLVTEARHVNDGMLRILALLAELQSKHGFLLFDEIENGINPELVQFLIDTLMSADQQILVTTHSPLILNYLSDQSAKDGVIYLYKTKAGFTKAVPFFSIPSLDKKLSVMGPGEAFADTNLSQLQDEIENRWTEGGNVPPA